MIESLN